MAKVKKEDVIPVYRGTYSADAIYEVNNIVYDGGTLFWHDAPYKTKGIGTGERNTWRKFLEITFDETPESGSGNPVTSGAVFSGIGTAVDADTTPTANSDKLVTSGGVYAAIGDAVATDEEPTENSTNLITSGAVWAALHADDQSGS